MGAEQNMFLAALETAKQESAIDKALFDQKFKAMQTMLDEISAETWQIKRSSFKASHYGALLSDEFGAAASLILETSMPDPAHEHPSHQELPSQVLTVSTHGMRALVGAGCGAKMNGLFADIKGAEHGSLTAVETAFAQWIGAKLNAQNPEALTVQTKKDSLAPKLSALECDLQYWDLMDESGAIIERAFGLAVFRNTQNSSEKPYGTVSNIPPNPSWQSRIREAIDTAPIDLSASISVAGYSLSHISKLRIGDEIALSPHDLLGVSIKADHHDVVTGTAFISGDMLSVQITKLHTATLAALPKNLKSEAIYD